MDILTVLEMVVSNAILILLFCFASRISNGIAQANSPSLLFGRLSEKGLLDSIPDIFREVQDAQAQNRPANLPLFDMFRLRTKDGNPVEISNASPETITKSQKTVIQKQYSFSDGKPDSQNKSSSSYKESFTYDNGTYKESHSSSNGTSPTFDDFPDISNLFRSGDTHDIMQSVSSDKNNDIPSTTTTTSSPGPCTLSDTTLPSEIPVCEGQLIFEETFEKPTNKFTPEVVIADQPDYPFVVYMKHEKNLFFRDGSVIIKPQLLEERFKSIREDLDITDECTAPIDSHLCRMESVAALILPPVISAKITTKHTFSFTYGRIEIVAKLPAGDWIYPEIQLEPRFNKYGVKNYASGIMRIASIKGNQKYAKDLDAGVIIDGDQDLRGLNMKYKAGVKNWNLEFHNYTMIWRPDSITVAVDGEEFGTIRPARGGLDRGTRVKTNTAEQYFLSRGTKLAPFDDHFYIAIGVAVGGSEFNDIARKPWTNDSPKARLDFWNDRSNWLSTWNSESILQVKSVRVYAL